MKNCIFTFAIISIMVCCSDLADAQNVPYYYKEGDPRIEYFNSTKSQMEKVAEEYEAWRTNPAEILAKLGPDKDWEEDVKKAKATNGHVVVAEIKPGEPVELCMLPADIAKVTHLKLTGRAYKWNVYDAYATQQFVEKLKNLKVLNMRDLDCEVFDLECNNLEKYVAPANCKAFMIGTFFCNLKELILFNNLEVISSANYGPMQPGYGKTYGLHTGKMREVTVPEGVVYIANIVIDSKCEKITLPSSLRQVYCISRVALGMRRIDVKNLKEIHLKSMEPPIIGEYQCDLTYEQTSRINLYVPKGTKGAYMKHLTWRNFNIIECD